jgi:hypothetical protein
MEQTQFIKCLNWRWFRGSNVNRTLTVRWWVRRPRGSFRVALRRRAIPDLCLGGIRTRAPESGWPGRNAGGSASPMNSHGPDSEHAQSGSVQRGSWGIFCDRTRSDCGFRTMRLGPDPQRSTLTTVPALCCLWELDLGGVSPVASQKREIVPNGYVFEWGYLYFSYSSNFPFLPICSAEKILWIARESKSLVGWLRFENPRLRTSLVHRE